MERLDSLAANRLALAAAAAVLATACGGGGGADLSTQPVPAPRTTIVSGRVLAGPDTPTDPITVVLVSDPAVRATVAEDGTFTLRGVPPGNQGLMVLQRSDELPRITLGGIANDQEIAIELRRFADELVLTGEKRRGLGAAAVEFEGQVENAILVSPAADSRFVIGSRSVIVRPGITVIHEGTAHRGVDQLPLGRRVFVRGAALGGGTEVLAFQVWMREADDGDYEREVVACHAPPGLPTRFKNVTMNTNAWHSHEPHNDALGVCKP